MPLRYDTTPARALSPDIVQRWRTLQAAQPRCHSPYFTPDFTQAVAAIRPDVHVALIHEGDDLVGLLPYQRGSLGRGLPVGGPLSDFHGVLTRPGLDWSLTTLLRGTGLASWAADHVLDIDGRLSPHLIAHRASPRVDLSQGYEAYVQQRRAAGSDTIAKLAGQARKLARDVGEVHFSYHVADEAGLDELFAWKRQQLQQRGQRVLFDHDWTVALLRRIARTQNEHFAGVSSELRAGDHVIARHFGMRSTRTLHYWFPCYDPAFARYSPGIIGLLRLANAAADQGVHTLDLGCGDEPYKQALKTDDETLGDGIVTRATTVTGASLRALQAARHWYRRRGPLATALRAPVAVLQDIQRQRRFR